jgi:tRNA pseudouridine55 synthase
MMTGDHTNEEGTRIDVTTSQHSGSPVGAGVCGVLNLNKPTGVTSRAVVDRVARPLRRVKVGHAGTLDPLASGVLVVCLGAATRLIEYVQRMPKTYRTTILLGARSDTDDADGTVIEHPGAIAADAADVHKAVAAQVGTILQKPPGFSALKVEGRRAYDLARAGHDVDLAPRPVTIHGIEVLAYDWPRLELEVHCEGGTYIRAIARDIGEALGCGGLVTVLVRTRIGRFGLDDALDPTTLTAENLPGLVRPALEAVAGLPVVRLTASEAADVAQGRSVTPAGTETTRGEVALLGPDGTLVAIGAADPAAGRIAPRRVLVGV